MKDVNQVVDNTLDSLNKARTARPVAGASRKGNNPVLFLIGNSTMRTGTLGNGNNGQWGWGYYAGDYFDSNRIIAQQPELQGLNGIKALCDHLIFKKDVTCINYMPIDLLTVETIDYYHSK